MIAATPLRLSLDGREPLIVGAVSAASTHNVGSASDLGLLLETVVAVECEAYLGSLFP